MGRLLSLLVLVGAAMTAVAEVQVIGGQKYECRDGLCTLVDDAPPPAGDAAPPARLAQGYMAEEAFLRFLHGEASEETWRTAGFGSSAFWLALPLILLGGLALNLTPCVLPLVPINLLVIGKSAARGAAYGLGMAAAYGGLGVAAALGSLAFGTIQASPWFNAAVALVFVALALALLDVWFLDFARFRPPALASAAHAGPFSRGVWALAPAFLMGALAAVLAGACVAPILVSVLLLTAGLYAEGVRLALGLPFLLGLGMALPWPFLGAGLRVLPRPGAWMRNVNRVFALVVLGFAVHYGLLAWRGWTAVPAASGTSATPATFEAALTAARAASDGPILVDCWATWCKSCSAMERVLERPAVRAALGGFTVIRLQAEDIAELRRLKGFEGVRGLPAFVVFEQL